MARIVIVVYEGAQGLDVFGPAEVFAAAARFCEAAAYQIVFAAVGGGSIRTTAGARLETDDLLRIRPRASDSVLVVGAEQAAIRAALANAALRGWLARAAGRVHRLGSVCSGAFLLAQAGVLDGRRVATHWAACQQLAAFRPALQVDANAIFVRDGELWTSAGITTGIDMALALVEEDWGRRVADAIAGWLVLHARRPGFQAQFSAELVAQTDAANPLGAALTWLRANLQRGVDVPRFARRAGVSARTLHRLCMRHLNCTPAKLIERLRVEHAHTLLATTALGTKTIAAKSGFANPQRMARAFGRTLGVAPRELRLLRGG
jgi:transcriptional regulator GlxA family with amidase domain